MPVVLTSLGVDLQRILFIFLFNYLSLCKPAAVLHHRTGHQEAMPCTLCHVFPQALTCLGSSYCLCWRWSVWSLRNCSLIGWLPAWVSHLLGAWVFQWQRKASSLFTHSIARLSLLQRVCVGGPALHRLPWSCSCAGLLIQWDYKENIPFIVKNGITSPLHFFQCYGVIYWNYLNIS